MASSNAAPPLLSRASIDEPSRTCPEGRWATTMAAAAALIGTFEHCARWRRKNDSISKLCGLEYSLFNSCKISWLLSWKLLSTLP